MIPACGYMCGCVWVCVCIMSSAYVCVIMITLFSSLLFPPSIFMIYDCIYMYLCTNSFACSVQPHWRHAPCGLRCFAVRLYTYHIYIYSNYIHYSNVRWFFRTVNHPWDALPRSCDNFQPSCTQLIGAQFSAHWSAIFSSLELNFSYPAHWSARTVLFPDIHIHTTLPHITYKCTTS